MARAKKVVDPIKPIQPYPGAKVAKRARRVAKIAKAPKVTPKPVVKPPRNLGGKATIRTRTPSGVRQTIRATKFATGVTTARVKQGNQRYKLQINSSAKKPKSYNDNNQALYKRSGGGFGMEAAEKQRESMRQSYQRNAENVGRRKSPGASTPKGKPGIGTR